MLAFIYNRCYTVYIRQERLNKINKTKIMIETKYIYAHVYNNGERKRKVIETEYNDETGETEYINHRESTLSQISDEYDTAEEAEEAMHATEEEENNR